MLAITRVPRVHGEVLLTAVVSGRRVSPHSASRLSRRVRLSCEKCGRSGQYRKQTLIDRYGADIRLPELREEIAQCERRGLMHDAYVVRYVDLIPQV